MVVKGESLYRIAKLYNTTIDEIKRNNNLTGDVIYPGQLLKVNPQGYSRPDAFVIGYYTEEEAYLPSSYWSAVTHMDNLSRLAPFWFRLNQYDPADLETAGAFTQTQARNIIEAAHNRGLPVIPVIHNFLYQNKSFTKNLVTKMLSTPESRNECIENIIKLIEHYNFDGVNMDFEGIRASDRDRLSVFYQELGDRLRAKGYIFTAAVPAKERDNFGNPWAAPYDYEAIGKAADQVMLMMYNEHGFPGSGPGPVSSIGFNHSVVNYAIKKIPAHKIILAEPVFGFDFNLETGKHEYLSHELAMRKVRDFGSAPLFDLYTQTPFFSYVNPDNDQRHEVWYENASSLKRKLDLISQYDLGGLALWRLGMEDPQIWQAIREKVNVK